MTNIQAIRLMPEETIAEILVKIYRGEEIGSLNNVFARECHRCSDKDKDGDCNGNCARNEYEVVLEWLREEVGNYGNSTKDNRNM